MMWKVRLILKSPFTFSCSNRPIEPATLQAIKVVLRVRSCREPLMILPVAWLKVSTACRHGAVRISDRLAEQAFGAIGIDLETESDCRQIYRARSRRRGRRLDWVETSARQRRERSKHRSRAIQAASLAQTSPLGRKKNDGTNNVSSSRDSLFRKQYLKKVVVTEPLRLARSLSEPRIELAALADWFHPELREKETKDVGQLFNSFAQRRADAMSGTRRVAAGSDAPICLLLSDAPSFCANDTAQRDRRSRRSSTRSPDIRAIGDVMIGRVGEKRLELVRIFNRPEFSHVKGAIRRQLDAQHVVDADCGHDRAHQIGMLRKQCSHQQAAVASAEESQLFRARVFLLDQILSRRRKIIENVLFLREVPGLVPFLAELAAAANIGHDIDAATVEPKPPGKIKGGRHADAITAIAIEQRRIVPIELRSLACMMFSGTFVPSFEVANSRVTSMSGNETGEVLTSAVFFGSVWPAPTWNQLGGSV